MSTEDIKDSSYTDDQEKQGQQEQITELKTDNYKLNVSNINQTDIEQINQDKSDLHNQILEKLDILKKEVKKDSLNVPKNEKNCSNNELEIALKQDFNKIQTLIKSGIINSKQGQNLKKEVLKKAFDKLVQTEKIKRALNSSTGDNKEKTQINQPVNNVEDFNKANPDFFTSAGRQEVLSYLKANNANFGRDELDKISELVRLVEKTAIERYLQKMTHEKTLRDSNEAAKQKLSANAQKAGFSGNSLRSFTREQIGKMSGSEFTKYEPAIMDALKKGLIK